MGSKVPGVQTHLCDSANDLQSVRGSEACSNLDLRGELTNRNWAFITAEQGVCRRIERSREAVDRPADSRRAKVVADCRLQEVHIVIERVARRR